MLGALALGAVIFIKVLPQLQQTAAAGGGGGQGVWTQVPGTTTCGMIGTACPTLGANDSTGWCVCSASAAAPATSTAASSTPIAGTTGCASIIIGNGNCPCCLANNTCKNNSSCTCSGSPCATQTHASSTKNKPSSQPKTLAGQPTKPTLAPRLAPFTSATPGRPAAPGANVNPLSHIVPGLG